MQLLANKTESGFTVLSDTGIVVFNVSEQSAREAIYERFPDAPATEVENILDSRPSPGAWRSLFASATTAELQKISDQIMEGGADTAAIQERLDQAMEAQAAMMESLNDLSAKDQNRDLREAQCAIDDEHTRLVQELVDEMGTTFEAAMREFGPAIWRQLLESDLGARIHRLRGNV